MSKRLANPANPPASKPPVPASKAPPLQKAKARPPNPSSVSVPGGPLSRRQSNPANHNHNNHGSTTTHTSLSTSGMNGSSSIDRMNGEHTSPSARAARPIALNRPSVLRTSLPPHKPPVSTSSTSTGTEAMTPRAGLMSDLSGRPLSFRSPGSYAEIHRSSPGHVLPASSRSSRPTTAASGSSIGSGAHSEYTSPSSPSMGGASAPPTRRNSSTDLEQKRKTRVAVLKEILATEDKYVRNLQAVVEVFLNPLRVRSILKDKETVLASIFGNIETIMTVNLKFFGAFSSRVKQNATTHTAVVGDVFSDHIPHFKHYVEYNCNYESAIKQLEKCKQKFTQFREFLEEALRDSRCQGLDLGSFLILPVQRIPRYNLLLEELLKNTEPGHPDFPVLKRALREMRATTQTINEAIRERQGRLRLTEIQEKITPRQNLAEPHRVLVREGALNQCYNMQQEGAQPRMFYLCNDILVYTDSSDHYLGTMGLQFAVILDCPATGPMANGFQLVAPDVGMTLCAANYNEKTAWMNDIQTRITQLLAQNPESREQRLKQGIHLLRYGYALINPVLKHSDPALVTSTETTISTFAMRRH